MTGEVDVRTEEALNALNALKDAASCLESAIRLTTFARYSQTSSKWGTEQGPQAFQEQYRAVTNEAGTILASLREQLKAFDDGIRKAIDRLNNADNDAAAAQVVLEAKVRYEEEASKPPPPLGSQPGTGGRMMATPL